MINHILNHIISVFVIFYAKTASSILLCFK